MEKFPMYSMPLPIVPSPHYKIVLYTCCKGDHIGSDAILMMVLMKTKMSYVTKNCYNHRGHLTELEELVGKDNVKFPMMIVNGKDVCGNEGVEGFREIKDLINNLRKAHEWRKELKMGMSHLKGLFCSKTKNISST